MEILFKAKRKDTGEWVEGYVFDNDKYGENRKFFIGWFELSQYSYNDYVGWRVDGYYICEVDPNTVCQYIKQKDKYGKPIFENDIVTIENTKKQGLPGVVVYNRTSASFELARDGYNSIRLDYFEDGKSEFVVVGNIFDKENE